MLLQKWVSVCFLGSVIFCSSALANTIRDIVVYGAQRIDPSTVTAYFPMSVGDEFDEFQLNIAVKRLFDTGLFADVRVREDNGILSVAVEENPSVNEIFLEGNSELADETLMPELMLKPRIVFTPNKAENDARRILNLYQRSGRYAARVEPKIIKRPQNRVDVVFEIFEGNKTYIEQIGFVGNTQFKDRKLRSVILSEEAGFLASLFSANSIYDQDRLAVDREKLIQFYRSEGFADVVVGPAFVKISDQSDAFSVIFSVNEGQRYVFGDVSVQTKLPGFDAVSFKKLVKLEPETQYDSKLIRQFEERLSVEAEERGYAFADVKIREIKDRQNRKISVDFELVEGPKIYIERIDILGNIRTRDRVIRREIDLVEGDPFNRLDLRLAKRDIERLGFFKSVSFRELPGTAPDKVIVVVDVEEQSTGELTLGAGFSTVDNFVFNVGLKERNLLGTGRELKAIVSLAAVNNQIDLGVSEPYLLGREVSGDVNIFANEEDVIDQSGYKLARQGFSFGIGFPLSSFDRLNTTYTLKNEDISDISPIASRAVIDSEGELLSSSILLSHRHQRDFLRFGPDAGYSVVTDLETSGLGGEVKFVRASIKASGYITPYEDVTFRLTGETGALAPFDGYESRVSDRFQLGGFSLRGFERGGLGPRDADTGDALGGQYFGVLRSEMNFPLGQSLNDLGFRGAIYADAGSVWDVGARTNGATVVADESSLRASVGAGVIWTSPFGPLRFNLSSPVLKEDVDKTESFQFTIGTRF